MSELKSEIATKLGQVIVLMMEAQKVLAKGTPLGSGLAIAKSLDKIARAAERARGELEGLPL